MKQIIFMHALKEALNSRRFRSAYTHTVLPVKDYNAEQYHRLLIKLVLMYTDDFINGLNLDKHELEYNNFSDNWDWNDIESLLKKEKVEWHIEKVSNYVVIDDFDDLLPEQEEHAVITNTLMGITEKDAEKAIIILEGK